MKSDYILVNIRYNVGRISYNRTSLSTPIKIWLKNNEIEKFLYSLKCQKINLDAVLFDNIPAANYNTKVEPTSVVPEVIKSNIEEVINPETKESKKIIKIELSSIIQNPQIQQTNNIANDVVEEIKEEKKKTRKKKNADAKPRKTRKRKNKTELV